MPAVSTVQAHSGSAAALLGSLSPSGGPNGTSLLTQTVVVPNFYLFGWLVFATETLIGVSLTLGLLTRAGALLGTLQSINLLVAQGGTEEGPWLYVGLIAANLAVLFTPSNRRLSLDHLLAPKLRASTRGMSRFGRVVRWTIGA